LSFGRTKRTGDACVGLGVELAPPAADDFGL
jgi:hypothetical protein